MKKKTGNRGAVMTELKTLALLSGGLLLGNMGGKAIDKLLKVDSTVPGMQLKKLARPLLLLGTGVAGAMRLKDGNLRMLSAGVGASGLLGTVETLTGKDLLSGVSGSMPVGMYREPVSRPLPRFEPDLPLLGSGLSASGSSSGSSLAAVYGEGPDMGFEMI